MSAARLSSLATSTLSLILERSRAKALNLPASASSDATITRNIHALRDGIATLEEEQGDVPSAEAEDTLIALQQQYDRLVGLVGEGGGEDVQALRRQPRRQPSPDVPPAAASSDSLPAPHLPRTATPIDQPYRDDPDAPEPSAYDHMQMQRDIMDDQDRSLDSLSLAISRQRDLGMTIGDELELHSTLLDDVESGVDRTERGLSGAQRRLDRVSKKLKGHGSSITIVLLIIILLILIIVFKT